MGRKAVFLDVDGTLVNDRGLVPDTAAEAIREARANGHLVFVSTGRSMGEIFAEIRTIGFDGYIAGAGAYVECDGVALVHHSLSEDDIRHVQSYFDSQGIEYFLESNDGLFGSRRVRDKLAEIMFGGITDEVVLAEIERGLGPFIDAIRVGDDPFQSRINKVVFLTSPTPVDEIRTEFAGRFDIIGSTVALFGPNSGEMSMPGIHKAGGVEALCEHFGLDRVDTLALGDGVNDLEMLAYVAVGIAMGNAPEVVKDHADEVTATPDEGGVAAAFARHGLISRTAEGRETGPP